MKRITCPSAAALISLPFFGASCMSYMTPGSEADLSAFTNPDVKKAFIAKPAIKFPANLAVVRVQGTGYQSKSAQGYGRGAYSVMTTRDVETADDIETIAMLSGVADVVTLNRLLLPGDLSSDLNLREAAAKLQADAILVYTLDTEFRDKDIIPPMTTLTLGLAPNRKYRINSAASAILMDTKTGYIYGALEESSLRSGITMAWGDSNTIDSQRKKAEREALDKLLEAFAPFWGRVHARHG